MASNDNRGQGGSNLLRSVVGVVPLALGAGVGIHQFLANEPVASILGPGSNAIRDATVQAGTLLRKSIADSKSKRERFAEDIAKQLGDDHAFQSMWAEASQQNAVLQSLISTIDDPSNGMNQATAQQMKEKLFDIINNSTNRKQQDTIDAVKNAIKSVVDSNSPDAKVAFANYLNEYKRVGKQLAPPVSIGSSGMAFNPVNTGTLTRRAKERLQRLRDTVGPGARIEVGSFTEADNISGIYGRVYVGQGQGARWLTNVPLDLSGSMRSGVPIIRVGENAQTAMKADLLYGRAGELANRFRTGKQESLTSLFKSGAIVRPEDALQDILASHINQAGSLQFASTTRLNASMRDILSGEHRGTAFLAGMGQNSIGGRLGRHLMAAGSATRGTVKVFGIEGLSKRDRDIFPQAFVGMPGFDPGVAASAMANRTKTGMLTSSVGIDSQAGIHLLKTSAFGDKSMLRHTFPITAREQQMLGREVMFFDKFKARGLGSSFSTGGMGGSTVEWAKEVTGGTNRAVFMDVTGGANLGVEGLGEAFALRGSRSAHHFTKPMLNAEAHKLMGSDLLNRLITAHKSDPKSTLTLSAKEIRQMGGFLGIGPNGNQYVRIDPYMERITLGISEITQDTQGKDLIHVSGVMEKRVSEGVKYFSTLFKGTQKRVTSQQLKGMLKSMGLQYSDLHNMGINPRDILVTTGDMLKKAPDILAAQMISGLGLVRNYSDPFAFVGGEINAGRVTGSMGNHKIGHVAEVVLNELSKGGADAETIGRVMAGAYHLDGSIKSALQARFAGNTGVMNALERGVAMGASTMLAGPQPGDWGAARGSMEQRFIKMMQVRLNMMGMKQGDVSNFIMNMVGRKAGINQQLDIAKEFVKMQASVIGQRTPLDELKSNVRRLTLGELQDEFTKGGGHRGGGLLNLLKEHDGILIDFNSDTTHQGQLIRAAAARAFGGQGEVYLPGGSALAAMRGADIKTAGKATIEIHPTYIRNVNDMVNNVIGLRSSAYIAEKHAYKQLMDFRENATQLFTGTLDSLVRGKVAGSSFIAGASYDLIHGRDMSARQLAHVRGIYSRTNGMAVFADSTSFLSAMRDFMGTTGDLNDTADRLKTFFTGSEKDLAAKAKGVATIMSRHPQLSAGHVAPLQVFRHVKEVGRRRSDFAFNTFTSMGAGKKALAELASNTNQTITSFRDIAGLGQQHGKHVSRFFRKMAGSLNSWVGWEGGGHVYFPQMQVDLTWNAASAKASKIANFSASSAMIGDFDGDYYQMMMLNKNLGGKIMSAMTGKDSKTLYLQREAHYKAASHIFMEEAKAGLDNIAGQGFTDKVMQDVLKEKALKQVGGLDVRLNMLRTSIMSFGGDTDLTAQGLAFLKTAEEFAAIKGKKLSEYHNFSEHISNSLKNLYETGEIGAFESVMKGEIFAGSNLWGNSGITVSGAKGAMSAPFITDHLQGLNIRGSTLMGLFSRSANASRERGNLQELESQARSMSQLTHPETAEQAFHNLAVAGETAGSGILRGYMQDMTQAATAMSGEVLQRIGVATTKLDRNLMAPVMAGAIGSMIAGSLLGTNDYSAQPLFMPGDMVDPSVSEAMANHSLFTSEQVGPSPDNFNQQGGQYDLLNRTINPGATYVTPPNAYQIRGETNNGYGFGQAANYLAGITRGRGSSSLMINDQRRPITSAYIDRFTGN